MIASDSVNDKGGNDGNDKLDNGGGRLLYPDIYHESISEDNAASEGNTVEAQFVGLSLAIRKRLVASLFLIFLECGDSGLQSFDLLLCVQTSTCCLGPLRWRAQH